MPIIKVGNRSIVGGGLHSRIASAKLESELKPKVDPTTLPNKLAIIADYSGSMDHHESESKTRLDLLKDAVQDFTMRMDTSTTAVALESFPKGVRIELTTDRQEIWMKMLSTRTLGATPMGEGLENTLMFHAPTRAMLISDGGQTDGEAPFIQARCYRENHIAIDCVHIGQTTDGEETLKKIAEMTGGLFLKFKDTATFAQSFHFLLPESRDEIAGMLPAERSKLLGSDE